MKFSTLVRYRERSRPGDLEVYALRVARSLSLLVPYRLMNGRPLSLRFIDARCQRRLQIGIEFEAFGEIAFGLGVFSLHEQRESAIGPGRCPVRVQFER